MYSKVKYEHVRKLVTKRSSCTPCQKFLKKIGKLDLNPTRFCSCIMLVKKRRKRIFSKASKIFRAERFNFLQYLFIWSAQPALEKLKICSALKFSWDYGDCIHARCFNIYALVPWQTMWGKKSLSVAVYCCNSSIPGGVCTKFVRKLAFYYDIVQSAEKIIYFMSPSTRVPWWPEMALKCL